LRYATGALSNHSQLLHLFFSFRNNVILEE
jgi:hypothetical protein